MSTKLILPPLVIILLFVVDILLIDDVRLDRNYVFADEIFRGKVTVLCVWNDGWSSREFLGDLAAIDDLPLGVQIVGIASSEEDLELAKELAPTIPQILANDSMYPILSKIKTAPTTIFVDANGNLVGQPVAGAEVALVRKELARILEMDSPRVRAMRAAQALIFR